MKWERSVPLKVRNWTDIATSGDNFPYFSPFTRWSVLYVEYSMSEQPTRRRYHHTDRMVDEKKGPQHQHSRKVRNTLNEGIRRGDRSTAQNICRLADSVAALFSSSSSSKNSSRKAIMDPDYLSYKLVPKYEQNTLELLVLPGIRGRDSSVCLE